MLKQLFVRVPGRRARRDRCNRRQARLFVETLEGRLVLSGDMVLRWNQVLMTAMQTGGLGNPAVNSRILAIVQAAVYDAVNSIDGTHTPYLADIPASAGASEEAAVAQAAHDTLMALYPAQSGLLDLELKASLETITDGDPKAAGIQVGQTAAKNILAARANDGSDKMVDYTPGTNPGDYQLTPPAYALPISPQWPGVTPFCLQSNTQFPVPPPPALTSAEYTAAFNQVKELGSFDSTTRTADQTEAAMFYAGVTPIGGGFFIQVNNMAQTVAVARGNSLVDNARMFALMELGLADEAIANWTAKYSYNFWRPVTAIRAADTDGNPDTEADPNWTTLLATPNIPSYPSQHSSAVGSTSVVFANFFGTDAVPFSVSWQGLPGVTRSFDSFSAWANECGQARIWAGFHWSFDVTAGLDLGRSVGEYISQNFLLPRTSPRPPAGARLFPFTIVNVTPGPGIGTSLGVQAGHGSSSSSFMDRGPGVQSTEAAGAAERVDQFTVSFLQNDAGGQAATFNARAMNRFHTPSRESQPESGGSVLDVLFGSGGL
jgi:membrane-associated phospholipid phosphatase